MQQPQNSGFFGGPDGPLGGWRAGGPLGGPDGGPLGGPEGVHSVDLMEVRLVDLTVD